MFGNTSTAQNFTIDSLENALNSVYQSKIPKPVFERSVSFGKAISNAIYDWSRSDGGHEAYLNLFPSTYTLPAGPGLWIPLPGQSPQLPYWGNKRTFIRDVTANTQPLQLPPPYSTYPSSTYYKEQAEVYNESINQDPEHRAIALYWAALSPPCVSISILSSVLASKNANLFAAAEAYCKVGIATADGYVSCYKTKYKFNQERPVNFIRANFNPAWVPLLPTPPFPDYTSGPFHTNGSLRKGIGRHLWKQYHFY
jgi:hypothetical protein